MSHQGDVIWIASKSSNMILDPFQSNAMVSKAVIRSKSSVAHFLGSQKPSSADTITRGLSRIPFRKLSSLENALDAHSKDGVTKLARKRDQSVQSVLRPRGGSNLETAAV